MKRLKKLKKKKLVDFFESSMHSLIKFDDHERISQQLTALITR